MLLLHSALLISDRPYFDHRLFIFTVSGLLDASGVMRPTPLSDHCFGREESSPDSLHGSQSLVRLTKVNDTIQTDCKDFKTVADMATALGCYFRLVSG